MINPFKNFYKPTPVVWRAIGDTLLATCGTISTSSIIDAMGEQDKVIRKTKLTLAVAMLLGGIVGKYLTNFFKKPADPTITELPKD
jgi:hypothetical protein